ncbi:MAG: PAS domain-containing protein, partial [Oceanicaulis sp.]
DITGEVLARARADLAIEAAGLGIWEWDLSTSIMTADPRFAAMLGRPWLAGQPGPVAHPLRFIHDEDRAAARAWMNDLEAGRIQRAEFEHRVVKPDGEMVWLVGSASVTESGHDGRPRKVLGVFEDRTARKTAEMEVAEAKLRYDVAVAGSHAAIWDQNLLTNEIYWTARLGEILGLGAEARTETLDDFLQRIHPDDIAFARENARRAIETREPLDNVLRIRRSDGVYRRLRSRAGVMYDPDGRPVRICGSITDITGELEAQARARLSGRRAEMALQAAHLGVWDYDAETGAVTADATLATLFGAPEIAGRTLTVEEIQSFTHPDDLNRVRADLARLHQTKAERVDNEHRVLRRDGTEIWVRADVGVAERDADGGVRRLIGIVQDLSGVKLTEALLRRTAEQARQASEAKSQFLATMSHEIRTPLNGVLGVVQLLELTDLDARQRRYVETVKASGRSLADVIEDVLDISRIEAGKLELRPEAAMVSDILDQASAPSRALASQKGLELNMTVSGDLTGPVLLDPRRVAQMVANLIGNAVKFTEAGAVSVRASRPDKAVLRIEVEDDGPGLPESLHEAVFERFTQADMSHSRNHQGSGLGLAIVRELAQLADGVAGVRSTPGQGACFWIEIPAPAAVRESRDAPDVADSAPSAGEPALRVLVVEDHPVNRAVTAELVSQAGHACETADCGEEALRRLKTRSADVILLDLHMPGMDGAEALARIRRGQAGAPDAAIYMVTADATPEARSKTLALGADGFFVKPLDAEALRRMLARVSERKCKAG